MIVLSAVASTVDRVVSCASAVAPSKITALLAFIVTEFTIVCVPVILMFGTDNVLVLGLYFKSPSDSSPRLPPVRAPPAVKISALLSSVDSLSVIVTVVAKVDKATAILAEPLKLVPPIVLAVASVVAVLAFPVTAPVNAPTNVVPVTVELNVAAPAADMSNVSAVIAEPPSSPLMIKSLSCTPVVITKSLDVFDKVAIVVPPSLKNTSPPSASRIISVVASSVIVEPESISAIIGVVSVLFVSVAVEVAETSFESPPLLGNVRVLPVSYTHLTLPTMVQV